MTICSPDVNFLMSILDIFLHLGKAYWLLSGPGLSILVFPGSSLDHTLQFWKNEVAYTNTIIRFSFSREETWLSWNKIFIFNKFLSLLSSLCVKCQLTLAVLSTSIMRLDEVKKKSLMILSKGKRKIYWWLV